MKFSRKFLQKYIAETLPNKEILTKEISAKAFEVEDVEIVNGDEIFEIKVLPNRAHDATGHVFMAREIARICDLKFNEELYMSEACLDKIFETIPNDIQAPKIKIEEVKYCTTFLSVKINNIEVKESPEWLKVALQNIGQKSINNIVDITNYVLFAVNKPMHAYDADKIKGEITVRFAKDDEKITTLDNREVNLDPSILIIADEIGPLSIAGVKGGNRAMVDSNTKNLILESANFNAGLIRKTSQKLNLKTDAAKRYENGLADSLCWPGIYMTLKFIKDIASNANTQYGAFTEETFRNRNTIMSEKDFEKIIIANHSEKLLETEIDKNPIFKVGVSGDEIRNILGVKISDEEIEIILKKVCLSVEKINIEKRLREIVTILEGKPYKKASSILFDAPNYFDCSSFTNYLYKEVGHPQGTPMPRMVVDQCVYATPIEKKDLRFGDLVFTNTGNGELFYDESKEYKKGTKLPFSLDHLGFYLGDSKIIHATRHFGKVVIENIDESVEFGSKVVAYGRICDNLNTERFVCQIPHYRVDLRLKEDLIEEVARLYGLDNIPPVIPNLKKDNLHHSQEFSKEIAIKNILFKNNFSEVITYSFVEKGEPENKVLKAVAEDKSYLRSNLEEGNILSLVRNARNAYLLSLEEIKTFEIGSVFVNNEEIRKLSICIGGNKKKNNYEGVINEIKKELNIKTENQIINVKQQKIDNFYCFFTEINLQDISVNSDSVLLNKDLHKKVTYKDFSQYPFTSQDVSFFANANASQLQQEFEDLQLKDCVNIYKFDEFTKKLEDGSEKTSFGFRFVFQSFEKTLTNEESLENFAPALKYLQSKNYEIR